MAPWIAARLGRLPKAAPFFPGTVVPLRGVPHRIVHRSGRARHGLDGDAGERRTDSVRAGSLDHIERRVGDYLKARSAPRSAKGRASLRCRARRPVKRLSVRDQVEPLGFVHLAGSLSFSCG